MPLSLEVFGLYFVLLVRCYAENASIIPAIAADLYKAARFPKYPNRGSRWLNHYAELPNLPVETWHIITELTMLAPYSSTTSIIYSLDDYWSWRRLHMWTCPKTTIPNISQLRKSWRKIALGSVFRRIRLSGQDGSHRQVEQDLPVPETLFQHVHVVRLSGTVAPNRVYMLLLPCPNIYTLNGRTPDLGKR